ncbi:MAG: cytochrome b/b6 domain-containing protein [Deltaproteobacteria bacterium]|nr:cytochrome b/b6 domain-containing protein [Deltaproteobacteria bacterium]
MTPCYRSVAVWSGLQRVIHWVAAFAVLLLIPLGLLLYFREYINLPDESGELVMDIHASIGFVFAAGLLTRIIYLFAGPPSSRLGDIVPHTKAQFALAKETIGYYLKGFKGKVPLYFSHNPFAGFAYAVYFIFAVTQVVSGMTMFLLHGLEHTHDAPDHSHSAQNSQAFPDWALSLHDMGALAIALFVLAHFTALAVHEIAEQRGLASSMISGNKFFSDEEIKELEAGVKHKTGGAR